MCNVHRIIPGANTAQRGVDDDIRHHLRSSKNKRKPSKQLVGQTQSKILGEHHVEASLLWRVNGCSMIINVHPPNWFKTLSSKCQRDSYKDRTLFVGNEAVGGLEMRWSVQDGPGQ